MPKIVVNGQSYDSVEAMPPEVRAAFSGPANSPDDLFGPSEFDQQPAEQPWLRSDQQIPQAPQWNSPPPTRAAGIKKWMLMMVLLDLLIFGGFLAWYFWLR